MKGFLNVFLWEVRLIFTKPMRLFLCLFLPLLFFFFFGYIFKNQTITELPIALVDYDNSSYSRSLTRMMESSSTMSVKYPNVDERQASLLLRTGKAYAYVVIPQDFGKNILKGRQNKVICYTNGQYMSAAGFIQSTFSTIVASFSAGVNIEKRTKQGQSATEALASTQAVVSDNHLLYNPYRNYNYFLNLGFIPMMFQLVVIYVSIFSFGMFFKTRTVHQLMRETLATQWEVLLGKISPYTIIFLCLSVLMNVFLFDVVGVPISGAYAIDAISLSLLFVLVCQSIAIFAVCFSPNLRMALTIGGGYAAISFAFTGYTFPFSGMPPLVELASNIFPLTHYLDAYINVVVRGVSPTYSLGHLIMLNCFFILAVASIPRFIQLIKNNGYERVD